MNNALYTVVIMLSLLYSGYAAAMFVTAQNLPVIGSSRIFTKSQEHKCLVCFAKKADGEIFFLLKGVLSTGKSKNIFTVPIATEKNPLLDLYTTLFPGATELKDIFIFDSSKLAEYKNKIRIANTSNSDAQLLPWWNSRQSLIHKTKTFVSSGTMLSEQEIKTLLEKSLDTFVENIKTLVSSMDRSGKETINNALTLIGPTVISDTASANKKDSTPQQKRDLITSHLQSALFGNFQTKPNVTFNNFAQLSQKEIEDLESTIKSVLMAEICYVCDLSKADLATALPRALYREVQKLGSTVGFGVQSFDPYLYTGFKSDLGKTFLGIGGLGAAAWLLSKYKSGSLQ